MINYFTNSMNSFQNIPNHTLLPKCTQEVLSYTIYTQLPDTNRLIPLVSENAGHLS